MGHIPATRTQAVDAARVHVCGAAHVSTRSMQVSGQTAEERHDWRWRWRAAGAVDFGGGYAADRAR